jgi:hypothetical protein
MTRRIDARMPRLGSPDSSDPEKIEELRQRVDKHERLTAKKTGAVFSEVLKQRMKRLRGEDDEEEKEEQGEEEESDNEPLLALHPGQAPGLANKKKVIVKG